MRAAATLASVIAIMGGAGAQAFAQAPESSPDGELLQVPPPEGPALRDIQAAVSATRIEADIRALAAFGTRHTLSDTLSDSRGIGAARRWIKAEFDRISEACGGCLEVRYQTSLRDRGHVLPAEQTTRSTGDSRPLPNGSTPSTSAT